MRAGEGTRVGGLDELQKCAGQAGFFEHPEAALRLRVVLLLPLQPLEEAFALIRRDERPLNREGSRHPSGQRGLRIALQTLLQESEELVGVRPIHDAVIEGKGEVRACTDRDRVLTVRAADDLWPLLDRPQT